MNLPATAISDSAGPALRPYIMFTKRSKDIASGYRIVRCNTFQLIQATGEDAIIEGIE
jgi:hypothetical protein